MRNRITKNRTLALAKIAVAVLVFARIAIAGLILAGFIGVAIWFGTAVTNSVQQVSDEGLKSNLEKVWHGKKNVECREVP